MPSTPRRSGAAPRVRATVIVSLYVVAADPYRLFRAAHVLHPSKKAQHFVLHHAGAFLIAMSAAGPVIWAGMPDFLKAHRDRSCGVVQATVDFIQHPAVAQVMFVGHDLSVADPGDPHPRDAGLVTRLYDLMNWTMAVDGIFFWCLILDPRPKPPARLSASGCGRCSYSRSSRFQMIVGAILSLSMIDYYPVYKICGRILGYYGDQRSALWWPDHLAAEHADELCGRDLRSGHHAASMRKGKSVNKLRLLEAVAALFRCLRPPRAPFAGQVSGVGRSLDARAARGRPGGRLFRRCTMAARREIALTGAQSPACGMLMLHKSSGNVKRAWRRCHEQCDEHSGRSPGRTVAEIRAGRLSPDVHEPDSGGEAWR